MHAFFNQFKLIDELRDFFSFVGKNGQWHRLCTIPTQGRDPPPIGGADHIAFYLPSPGRRYGSRAGSPMRAPKGWGTVASQVLVLVVAVAEFGNSRARSRRGTDEGVGNEQGPEQDLDCDH
jgi:hypothetical protein